MRRLVPIVLATLLAACARDGGRHADVSGSGIGLRYLHAQDDAGFSKADSRREFEFPRDHGSHPEYRTEWWYFTGNLTSPEGALYGFELTFFRVALKATRPEPARTSAWATDQVWMAHFAVTDVGNRRFLASEAMAREALGLAGAERDPVRVWLKGWSAQRMPDGPAEHWRLVARDGDTAVELSLATGDEPVLNGDRGLDRKGPELGNASYYYSLPRLRVKGTLALDGKAVPVEGQAWMDREWSTSALGEDVVGWDWFGLRLSDGGSLMFYRLRRRDGSADTFSGGMLVDGMHRQRQLRRSDVELTPLEYWTSESGGGRYPVSWRVRVLPTDLDLELHPYLANQELRLSVRYWEGAVHGVGTAGKGPISAEGYLELAGY